MPSSTSSGRRASSAGPSTSGRAQPKGTSPKKEAGSPSKGREAEAAPSSWRHRLHLTKKEDEPAKGKGGGTGRSRVGRYTPPEEKGRYTPPIPKKIKRSSPWLGVLLLALLILGLLMILLNYLNVLPGSVSTWYLIGGLGMFFAGFILATRYR